MVKKSEEERKLEKEVVELKKKGEELGVKDRKLKEMQYSRRLKMALMKSLGISFRDLEPERSYPQYAVLTNAVLDKIVEIIFDIFPNFKKWDSPWLISLDFHSCLQGGSFGRAIFYDEIINHEGIDEELKFSEEDLKKTLDLSRDDLMRIVFTAVIQAVVNKVLPRGFSGGGNIHGGMSIH